LKRAALTIVFVIIVAVAATGYYIWQQESFRGGSPSGGASGSAASLFEQVPAGAPFVLYADAATLRKAGFLAPIAATFPTPSPDGEYAQVVRETGFDYSRDLDRLIVAGFPGAEANLYWAEADGHFDQQKIEAYASRDVTAAGQASYLIQPSPADPGITLRFLSPERIELKTSAKLAVATDAVAGDASAYRARIARLSGAPLFVLLRIDSIPKGLTVGGANLDQIAALLEGVQWLALTATPESHDLRVVVEGECRSAVEAGQLQMGLEGFRVIGRTMLANPSTRRQFTPAGAAALDKLIGRIEISHDGPEIRLMAALTPDLLAGLAAPTEPDGQRARVPPDRNATK